MSERFLSLCRYQVADKTVATNPPPSTPTEKKPPSTQKKKVVVEPAQSGLGMRPGAVKPKKDRREIIIYGMND